MKIIICISIYSIFIINFIFADGILIPQNKKYPKNLLRNKITAIEVNINGLISETVVYQEFMNESDDTLNAVFAFPMPVNSWPSNFYYSHGDTLLETKIKLRPKSPNTNIETDSISSIVDKYLGNNALKIKLYNILPNSIQKIRLHYISNLNYENGICSYSYPFETVQLIPYPIEFMSLKLNLKTNTDIEDFDLISHPDFTMLYKQPDSLSIEYQQFKTYLTNNIEFYYKINPNNIAIDFYSCKPASCDGFFNLLIKTPATAHLDPLPCKYIFLIDNTLEMAGEKLQKSIEALSQALDLLQPADYFNIALTSPSITIWSSNFKKVTPENIEEARQFLQTCLGYSGNNLNTAIKLSVNQFQDDIYNNQILVFTAGNQRIDPYEIKNLNNKQITINFMFIGGNEENCEYELLAKINGGNIDYINNVDNIYNSVNKALTNTISTILSKIKINFKKDDIYLVNPKKYPDLFAGSSTSISGRYKVPEINLLSLSGLTTYDSLQYNYVIKYADNEENNIAKLCWAKQMIDDLQLKLMVYGENPLLRDSLIKLSINYNIPCLYTSYVVDSKANTDSIFSNQTQPTVEWKTFTENDTIEDTPYYPPTNILYNTEHENDIIINIFPNPISEYLYIKPYIRDNQTFNDLDLKIYEINGKIINEFKISTLKSENIFRVDLKNIKSKILFATLVKGKKVLSSKVIICK